MIIIKGTNKIKGALTLPSVKREIKKTDSFSISDIDFQKSDVQSAIRMGFISYEKANNIESSDSEIVECINTYHRPINLEMVTGEIKPGQSFTIKGSDLQNSDIQAAIIKGMISPTKRTNVKVKITESTLKIGNILKSKQEKTIKEEEDKKQYKQKMLEETQEEAPVPTEEKAELDTNTELFTPPIIYRPEEKDPHKKTIVWNPTGEKVIQEMKNATYMTVAGVRNSNDDIKDENTNESEQVLENEQVSETETPKKPKAAARKRTSKKATSKKSLSKIEDDEIKQENI